MFKRILSIVTLVVAGATAVSATTWYVDNTATGAGNGTSWANAWTSVSSVSGVKAGDTVYISGGPSGSSHTYSVNNWAPAGGSSSGVITYQIGQDSAHNGTAIFSGSGQFVNPSSYTAIVGDAGDGQMHFQASGYSDIVYGGGVSSLRLGYINFGSIAGAGNPQDVMRLDPVSGLEFDHNYVYVSSPTADAFSYMVTTDPAWDGTRIHDNEIHQPAYYRQGPDYFQAGGSTGYSIYNNKLITYFTSAASGNGQHQDGWQDTGGSSYIKLYNNYVESAGNSCFFGDAYYGGFTHLWIYNNVGVIAYPMVNGWYPEGVTIGPDGSTATKDFTDVQVMNNIMVDMDSQPAISMQVSANYPNATFTNCVIQNNISVNTGVGSPSGGFAYDTGVSASDNVNFNVSAANAEFVKYVPYDAYNNFHLTPAAASLIGQGANESVYFITDDDGNRRPASGAWDIGPYEYGASSSPLPTLTLSAITQNSADVDPITPGFQVYEGTVASYYATVIETSTNAVSWQWTYTLNGGSPVVYQSGTNTVSGVRFDYAPGTGGNTYIWTLSATDGKTTASSSFATGVEVPPSVNTNLSFQVTAGTITYPLTVTGTYVSQPVQTVISNAGEVSFNFTITNAGNYLVQALVNAANAGANSFYVSVDAQPVDPTTCWDIPNTTNFEKRIVSWRGNGTAATDQYVPKVFALAAGAHQIIFAGRDPNTELESFSLLAVPPTPQNLRVLPTVSGSALNFNAGP